MSAPDDIPPDDGAAALRDIIDDAEEAGAPRGRFGTPYPPVQVVPCVRDLP